MRFFSLLAVIAALAVSAAHASPISDDPYMTTDGKVVDPTKMEARQADVDTGIYTKLDHDSPMAGYAHLRG